VEKPFEAEESEVSDFRTPEETENEKVEEEVEDADGDE
jgi:hypothetical protein